MSNRTLIIALAFVAFFGALTQLAVTPLLGVIADDLDVSVALIGQAVTITFVSGATLGLVAGPMGDHYGHRRLMMAGGLFAAFSLFASAIAPSYGLFLVSRIPGGLGGATLAAIAVVIAATRLPESERRAGIGWIFAAFSMAPILGFPIMTEIGDRVGWRASMLVISLLILMALPFVWTIIGPDGQRPERPFQLKDTLQAYLPILRDTPALMLQATNFFRTVAGFGVYTYAGAYLMEIHGVSLATVGYVYIAVGVGYFTGSRFGDGRYISMSFRAFQSVTALIFGIAMGIPFIFSLGAVPTAIGLTIGSAAVAAGFVALIIMISEESPGGTATALMLRQSGFAYGTAASSALGGVVLATAGFVTFGMVTVLLALVSAAVGQWNPGRNQSPAPAPQVES